jgi:aminobenzoyl-glutamate utilization protein A
MDALPVKESTKTSHRPTAEGYASTSPGVMHACGHDGHVAIGLALAANLAQRRPAGRYKLLFQPAEEGGRGATAMVAAGIVDDVDALYCLHLGMGLPTGAVDAGARGFLASTKMRAELRGLASHASMAPEQGRNALIGAAQAMLSIHALPHKAGGQTRAHVGRLVGGVTANIVPDRAEMILETRAGRAEENAELVRRLRRIVHHSAAMHELKETVRVIGRTTTIQNDSSLVTLVGREIDAMPSLHRVENSVAVNSSEDAGFLMERVQRHGGLATYMILGADITAPHHSSDFDLDERALPLAVELLERIGQRTSEGATSSP